MSNKTKVAHLRDLAEEANAPWIMVTETWLTPDVLDAEIAIKGYELFRADREGRSHGGTCCWVREDLTAVLVGRFSNSYCDSLVIKIKELEMLLIGIYRPPNCDVEHFKENIEVCQETIDEAMDKDIKIKDLWVQGDFNLPFIKWPEGNIYEHDKTNDRVNMSKDRNQAKVLVTFVEENFLVQQTLTPTRGKNILDLTFTNNAGLINGYKTIVNSKLSDHFTQEFDVNLKHQEEKLDLKKENPYKTKIFEYDVMNGDKEDWIRYEQRIRKAEENWEDETTEMNTDEMLQHFTKTLENIVQIVFKKKEAFNKKSRLKETRSRNRIPRHIRTLMLKKSILSKKIMNSLKWQKTYKMMQELEEIEEKLQENYKSQKWKKEKEAMVEMKRNPKFFYSYAKKHSKAQNNIGHFLDKNGDPVKETSEICKILKNQYESVWSTPNPDFEINNPEEFFEVCRGPSMTGPSCDQTNCITCPMSARQDKHKEVPVLGREAGDLVLHEELVQGREAEELAQQEELGREAGDRAHQEELLGREAGDLAQQEELGREAGDMAHQEELLGREAGDLDQQEEQGREAGDLPNQEELVLGKEAEDMIQTLEDVHFDSSDVEDAIDMLSLQAVPGPDGVPAICLKRAKTPISRMLNRIFQRSYAWSDVPDDLKLAFVTPIHKSGTKSEPANFRPVSLTSHIIKTFERVIRKDIVSFLETGNKMDPNQHGSRSGRSTLSQLLEQQDEILATLEEGANIDMVYLDFSKVMKTRSISAYLLISTPLPLVSLQKPE